jgi:hypothetical protein
MTTFFLDHLLLTLSSLFYQYVNIPFYFLLTSPPALFSISRQYIFDISTCFLLTFHPIFSWHSHLSTPVIHSEAGIQEAKRKSWIPVFTGITLWREQRFISFAHHDLFLKLIPMREGRDPGKQERPSANKCGEPFPLASWIPAFAGLTIRARYPAQSSKANSPVSIHSFFRAVHQSSASPLSTYS